MNAMHTNSTRVMKGRSGGAHRRARRGVAASLVAAVLMWLCVSAGAFGAAAWRIDAAANPQMRAGRDVQYLVRIANVGDVAAPPNAAGDTTNCTPTAPPPAEPGNCYTVTARFPAEVEPTGVVGIAGANPGVSNCVVDGASNTTTCSVPGSVDEERIDPSKARAAVFLATIDPGASGVLTTAFEVAGAGAGSDATVETVRVSDEAPTFGVAEFDVQVSADGAGSAFTQAAGHPFAASTAIEFNSMETADIFASTLRPVEPVKNVVVDLPPGFVGNPTAVDQCSLIELSAGFSTVPRSKCPPTSQVGTTTVRTFTDPNWVLGPLPVFNMVTGPNTPARFGFNAFGSVILLDSEVRSEDDYGVTIVAANVPTALGIQATEVTLWGVPADPSHDNDRACPGEDAPWFGGPTCSSGAARKAFLRNPTMCTPDGEGLVTTINANSWLHPENVSSRSLESHLPPAWPAAPEDWGDPQGPTDCDTVPFDPTLRGTPAAGTRSGEPSGFSFDLSLPQTDEPLAIGQSDLKKAVVTLPEGVRVSPSSASGLAGCSSEQIGLDNRDDARCPDGSKLGSLTIETPLLRDPLQGAIYLATPFDNPFDSLIAIYIVARGPGFTIKLPGQATPDASKNGQLTAVFDDNPQVPFERLHLEFKGGPRAPLVMPKKCGTYTTHAELTSWSGKIVAYDSSFMIDRGCGGGFRPGFTAGTESSAAGKSSPFLLRLTRDDSDEELKGITLNMPEGLVGRIADVDLCGDAQAAAGTCSGASKVGSVTVGAGAGTNPFYITNGRAYLTGPYRGAPFGLSIVVPAVAGPFDLGLVVVRSTVHVDKHTAKVTVVSDPLPTQLQGIPLDVKDVRVDVDRPGFWLNPTSCEEKTISGVIESTLGSKRAVSSRFQAYDCAALPLRPRMVLRVGGRGRTQRGRSTPFTATLRQTPGQAGLARVQVTLPTTINARLTVINDACTRAQYEAGNCEDARTGSATAVTPLLRDPLRGGVYFVRNANPLPDLFVRLRGQVDFDLIGRITIPGSKRLRTTFNAVPDVPVSSFTLRLASGREGSIGNATNLCSRRGRTARAELDFIGQNGRVLQLDQRLKIRGCRRRAARSRRGGRGRRSARRGR